jgi:hypothetical protein
MGLEKAYAWYPLPSQHGEHCYNNKLSNTPKGLTTSTGIYRQRIGEEKTPAGQRPGNIAQ